MSNFLTDSYESKSQWFHDLRLLAQQDLSQAHIRHHRLSADNALKFAGMDGNAIGTHSSVKPNDNITTGFDDNLISGTKHWVSDSIDAEYGMFYIKPGIAVIVPDLKHSSIVVTPVPTVGMENTFTAHLTFNNTPALKLFNKNEGRAVQIFYIQDYAFITNLLGLSEGLFNDIDQYTKNANISCDHEKRKVKLNIDVLGMMWKDHLPSIETATRNNQIQAEIDTIYSFAKQTLLSVIHLVTEFTGSGIYQTGTPENQRLKDALIYSSHWFNMYTTLLPTMR